MQRARRGIHARRACVYALATSCACFCRFVATQPASALQQPCTASADGAWAAGATGVVTVPLHGLLANLMFAVASLEGIASTLQRAPLLSIGASCLCSGPGPDQDLSRRRVQAFAASFGLQLCEEGAESIG